MLLLRLCVPLLALVTSVAACSPKSFDVVPSHASLPSSARGPLNVLLVTIDALRADHLACYGYSRKTSPNIDRLAARGVLFEQACAQWPKTGPSLASLLSSTYGSTSGVMRVTLVSKIPRVYELLPEVLHNAGYETMGYVTNVSLAPKFQYDQGFEHYVVDEQSATADHTTEGACRLFDQRDKNRPFFLWVHYLDPHAPYQPPQNFSKDFVGDDVYVNDVRPPVPVDPRVQDPNRKSDVNDDVGQIPAYAYIKGKDRTRDYVVQYDGEVRYMDQQVGVLLDHVMAGADRDRTLVVVTADHGEALGEHNYFFEHGRFPYDDCVHVPLIICHPDWKPRRVASAVGLIDVAPTMADLVGLKPGWQCEGSSLVKWVAEGAPEQSARPVFTESGYSKEFEVSLRRGRWKLIRVGSKYMASMLTAHAYELYDVVADPGETHSLVDDEPDVFASLKTELDAYVEIAYKRVPPPQDGAAVQPNAEDKKKMDALGYGDDKERAEQGDDDHVDKKKDGTKDDGGH